MATDYAEDTINKYGGSYFGKVGSLGTQRADINLKQRGEVEDYLSRLRGGYAKQEALPHMYERLSQELNIPNLRQSATQLQTTLAQVPQTYTAATRGFDVNANQLQRIIGQKAGELAPAVQAAQTGLESALSEAQRRVGYGVAQQEKEMRPFETEKQLLSERQAREYTGYNTDMQAELEGYLNKLKMGVQLTEAEKGRAHELATIEKQFQNQKALKQMDIDAQKYALDKQYNNDPLGLFG